MNRIFLSEIQQDIIKLLYDAKTRYKKPITNGQNTSIVTGQNTSKVTGQNTW